MAPKRRSEKSDQNSKDEAKQRGSAGKKAKKSTGNERVASPNAKNIPMKKTSNGEEKSSGYTCWLVKSEPNSRFEKGQDMKFSFDDLKSSPGQTACWDGVRNYQARNFLRDQMKVGHDVFFYHSNCKEPGIVGICKIVKESYPDHTQFDTKDPHYDSSCTKDNPKWFMVDVKYVRPLKRFISLAELKKLHQDHVKSGGPLRSMALFTRARLSVQPISKEEWDFICQLEESNQET